MNEVKVLIEKVEDLEYMKKYLNEDEKKFLNTIYNIEYEDNTNIGHILKFLINGLQRYYKNHHSGHEMYEDDFIKRRFDIIINKKNVKIFDLDIKIKNLLEYIKLNEIHLYFIIEAGGGFEALEQDNGIKYIMKTHEKGSHNKPHIHVQYSGKEVVIDILNGNVIQGKINYKKQKEAISKIQSNQAELLLLWNTRTDGIQYEIKKENFFLKV